MANEERSDCKVFSYVISAVKVFHHNCKVIIELNSGGSVLKKSVSAGVQRISNIYST